jgi:predicted RNase H-like HicB family nuclease
LLRGAPQSWKFKSVQVKVGSNAVVHKRQSLDCTWHGIAALMIKVRDAVRPEGAALNALRSCYRKGRGKLFGLCAGPAGCIATGDTVKAVEAEIRDAIRFHIEGLKEDGLPVPTPTSIAEYVEA